jgi:hypothetical protein
MPIKIDQKDATIGQQIIGETVNLGVGFARPAHAQELRALIDALWLQVAEAQQRGELAPQIAQQAQAKLTLATQEAKQEHPEQAV